MDPDPTPFPCVLNETDTTSAMGWLPKQPQPSGRLHPQPYYKVPRLRHDGTKHMQLLPTPVWGAEQCD